MCNKKHVQNKYLMSVSVNFAIAQLITRNKNIIVNKIDKQQQNTQINVNE